MHKMVTRNRSRKESIDIDNEELPVLVANDVLNAEETSSFLRAESKDAESDIDIDGDGDLDGEVDDYVGADTDDDDDDFEDETRLCNDMVAMSSPYIREITEKVCIASNTYTRHQASIYFG